MKAEHHAAVSVPVTLGIWYMTGSFFYAAFSLFLGVFIDSDHVLDYIREEKKFDFRHMFTKSYSGDFRKLYVIFHCYEYIPAAWVYAWLSGNIMFASVFTIAYLFHMIPDQLTNNVRPPGYFFVYRAMVGFKMDRIFYSPEYRLEKMKNRED